MKLLLNTSTPLCRMTLTQDGEIWYDYEWQADRALAKGLLGFIRDKLGEHDAFFADIDGIGVYQGPGSFTGLRIGLTVANTIASSLEVPIVGVMGDAWRGDALAKLAMGIDDKIVLPEYGAEARITKPRK